MPPVSNPRAVMRITASRVVVDWLRPSNRSASSTGTGTGFLLAGMERDPDRPEPHFLLMTAYHVVQDARQILVRVEGESDTAVVPATLHRCNPTLDVALIAVPGALPPGVRPLPAGNSDQLRPLDEVEALGYALGNSYLQFTRGVVSGRTDDKIQIDVAINGGNSGGPLLHSTRGEVVGVVVSSRRQAQNVNFACPLREAARSLQRAAKAGQLSARAPSLNACFAPTPRALAARLGAANGVVCRFVHPASAVFAAGLREGDVLTQLDRHPVRCDRTVLAAHWPGPLPLEALLARRQAGEAVGIEFVRGGSGERLAARVTLEPDRGCFRTVFPEFEPQRSCSRGGVVAQPLLLNHVVADGGGAGHVPLSGRAPQLSALINDDETRARGLVVVTDVQAGSPFARNDALRPGSLLTELSWIPAHGGAPRWFALGARGDWDSFARYEAAWAAVAAGAAPEDLVTLHSREGMLESATWAECVRSEQ